MKITITAALSLLLSAIIVLPQIALAGKPPKPAPEDCDFPIYATIPACHDEMVAAYSTLEVFRTSFVSNNADKSYFGLRCKVAFSETKMSQDKPADAERKLADSVIKIDTLLQQRKIDSAEAAAEMGASMELARSCAYSEAYE